MRFPRTFRNKNSEAGVALLIAIFIMMLVSAVAISLVVSSGTESALAGNYRSSASVYYAAFAGLEEGRGRLLPKNADYFNSTVLDFMPPPGGPALLLGQVRYILNPLSGETVTPTNLLSTTTYPDKEYQTEFGVPVTSATVRTITSVSPVAGLPGPLYKWVRITAATEKSIGINVDNDGLPNDSVTPLYYDLAHTDALGNPRPSLIVTTTPPSTAYQVLQITALAVLRDRSEKLLQYLVTPVSYGLNFPAAVMLPGQSVSFVGANSNPYQVNGTDGSGNPPPVPGCTPSGASVPGVGVTDVPGSQTNKNAAIAGIPSNRRDHYTGAGIGPPSVSDISLPLNMQSPTTLNQLVQIITQNADLVINGNATQANMPSAMSVTNPMTIVVNGNFSMTGNYTGYGLMVVTGTFSYTGTTGWKGIVLVLGDGITQFLGSGGGNNEFDGAIFAATIKDASGNLLPSLGSVTWDISGGGGNGVYYNSCWVKAAQQPPTFKVLSFREIPYNE